MLLLSLQDLFGLDSQPNAFLCCLQVRDEIKWLTCYVNKCIERCLGKLAFRASIRPLVFMLLFFIELATCKIHRNSPAVVAVRGNIDCSEIETGRIATRGE
jgi:hypothetical protein